jgi:hypothetical protein
MTIRFALRALLSVGLLFGLSAGATTLLRTDVAELSYASDAVVHGTVRRVESRWSGDRRRIVTDVEIEVTESLKGQAGGRVVVTQPGGKVGDIGQMVHGLASFTPGEEVVVFLEQRGKDAFRVSGMAQGKFQVKREGKTALAVPEPTGDSLLLDPVTRQPTTSAMKTVSLAELKAAVRTALEQARPQPAQQAPAKPGQEKRQ